MRDNHAEIKPAIKPRTVAASIVREARRVLLGSKTGSGDRVPPTAESTTEATDFRGLRGLRGSFAVALAVAVRGSLTNACNQ